MAIRVIERKKAVAWAVWALGKDQSEGIGTSRPSESGRGRRKSSFAAWTEITLTMRFKPSKIASCGLFAPRRRRQVRMEKGRSRYNEPNQVTVAKNVSMCI